LAINGKGKSVYIIRFYGEVISSPALLVPFRIPGRDLLESGKALIGAA
jgi:hypothetical protein